MYNEDTRYFVDKKYVCAKLRNFLQALMGKNIDVIAGFAARGTGDMNLGQVVLLRQGVHRFAYSEFGESFRCYDAEGVCLFTIKPDGATIYDSEYRPLLLLHGVDRSKQMSFYVDEPGNLIIQDPEILEIWKNI